MAKYSDLFIYLCIVIRKVLKVSGFVLKKKNLTVSGQCLNAINLTKFLTTKNKKKFKRKNETILKVLSTFIMFYFKCG